MSSVAFSRLLFLGGVLVDRPRGESQSSAIFAEWSVVEFARLQHVALVLRRFCFRVVLRKRGRGSQSVAVNVLVSKRLALEVLGALC